MTQTIRIGHLKQDTEFYSGNCIRGNFATKIFPAGTVYEYTVLDLTNRCSGAEYNFRKCKVHTAEIKEGHTNWKTERVEYLN